MNRKVLKGNEITSIAAEVNRFGEQNTDVEVMVRTGKEDGWYRIPDMVLAELLRRCDWEVETIGANNYLSYPVTHPALQNEEFVKKEQKFDSVSQHRLKAEDVFNKEQLYQLNKNTSEEQH